MEVAAYYSKSIELVVYWQVPRIPYSQRGCEARSAREQPPRTLTLRTSGVIGNTVWQERQASLPENGPIEPSAGGIAGW